MMYCQITYAERYSLGLLRQRGIAPAAIARVLGRHRSSIARELRRNRSHSDSTYRPQLADWYARSRRSRSRRNTQFTSADWARVETLVREDWSPEQIAGRLRRDGILAISHETIYRYLWRTRRLVDSSTSICVGRASRNGNAMARTTVVGASPGSVPSRRGRPARRTALAPAPGG